MNKWILSGVVVVGLAPGIAAAAVDTSLQPGRPHDFGVGAQVGSPTGLTGKYWLSGASAVDALVGWHFGGNDRFQAHADYLLHFPVRGVAFPDGVTRAYAGAGLRVLSGPSAEAGFRLPLGLSHLVSRAPVEAFAEIAPVVRFAPDAGASIDGGVGVRYYFR